jgi:hypothetical protein
MTTEFSTLDGLDDTVSSAPVTVPENALELSNPDSALSGQSRGTQNIGGGPNLQFDAPSALIRVRETAVNSPNVLRLGQVDKGFLGMSVNTGTLDTMFAGRDSSGRTVVKIAKDGFDAKTATDDQLIFNSSQNIFKIVKKDTGTIPAFSIAAGGSAVLAIPHGQVNKVPICRVFVKGTLLNWSSLAAITSDYVEAPLVQDTSNNTNGYLFPAANGSFYPCVITFIADATNLYIQASYPSAVATSILAIPVTYFIEQETAI